MSTEYKAENGNILKSTPEQKSRPRFSRRAALRGAGTGAIGLLGAALVGCGSEEATPAATATTTATPKPTVEQSTSGPVAPKLTRGGAWQIATDVDPPTLYPYGTLEDSTKAIAAYSYQRLYKRETSAGGDGGETLPIPDLALGAETEDGVTWTLKLRDHNFHQLEPVNGRKITSEDVLFSVRLLQASETPNSSNVENWIKVEAPDDSTVVFTLDRPSPIFLEQLADTNLLQVLPQEADGGFDPTVTMIGGGPWIMRDYQRSLSFEFEANPDYYELGEDGNPVPYLDTLTVPIIPEYPRRLAQFLSGDLSALRVNPLDVIDISELEPALQWFGQTSQLTSILYWSNPQTTDAVWTDVRFRKAVSMALDRNGLSDRGYNTSALSDAGLPITLDWNNIIPAGWGSRWWLDPSSNAHGPSGAFFNHDLAEARSLLAAAGVVDGFEIPYLYTGRYGGPFPRIAEAQIDMLQAVGLAPQPNIQEYESTYLQSTFRGDFEGMAFGYETAFPEAGAYLRRLFGDDPANHSNISDPQLDQLVSAEAVALLEDDRRTIMHEAQIRNAEQMWYVPSQAGAGVSYTAYQSSVRGGLRDTLGHGGGTEEFIWYWLEA